MDTTTYFRSWWFWIPSIALLVYSLVSCLENKRSEKVPIIRIYYSSVVIFYTFILKHINLFEISGDKGLLSLSKGAWSVTFFTIVYLTISILIEKLIISGQVIGSLSLFGSSAIFKDEDKENSLALIRENIISLEMGIESITKTYKYMVEYLRLDSVIAEINESTFEYDSTLATIVNKYYKYKGQVAIAKVFNYSESEASEYIKEILNNELREYAISNGHKILIKNEIKKDCIYQLFRDKDNILFIPAKSHILNELILIVIKSSEDINLNDVQILNQILFVFELSLVQVLNVNE